MNEQIQKLIKQAKQIAAEQHTPGSSEYEREIYVCFAELIVRECAGIVNKNDFEGSSLGDRLLFEHFGVE